MCERYSARFRSDLLGAEDSESRNGPVFFFLITDIVNIRDEAMCRNVIGCWGAHFLFPSFYSSSFRTHISSTVTIATNRQKDYRNIQITRKRSSLYIFLLLTLFYICLFPSYLQLLPLSHYSFAHLMCNKCIGSRRKSVKYLCSGSRQKQKRRQNKTVFVCFLNCYYHYNVFTLMILVAITKKKCSLIRILVDSQLFFTSWLHTKLII